MKKFCILLIITILGIILSSGYSMACHEEAMGGELGIGPTLKGHNPSTRVNGFLVITESTTAVSSTSTSCDAYIGFLDKNYYQIAANVAKGDGIFLDALMSFYGCSTIESKNRLENYVQENYIEIFENHDKNGQALGNRLVTVLKRNKIFYRSCSNLNEVS